MEENKRGQVKTKPVRGYWRADNNSELGKLIQKRYELQKRLNSLLREDIELELEKVNRDIKALTEKYND